VIGRPMSTITEAGNPGLMYLGNQMEIEFESVHDGTKIFKVRKAGEKPLFTGTLEQCKRFIDVYKEKVLKQIS